MANAKKPSRDGNSQQLLALEKVIEEQKILTRKILDQKEALREEIASKTKELSQYKTSIAAAYEKIKLLEDGATASEVMKTGYVEMATLPINGEIYPHQLKIGGVIIPSRRDADGVLYESLPVEKAIAIMTEGSGFKRYLVGPAGVYEIKGRATFGVFKKDVSFKLHKKVGNGMDFKFIQVELEESEG